MTQDSNDCKISPAYKGQKGTHFSLVLCTQQASARVLFCHHTALHSTAGQKPRSSHSLGSPALQPLVDFWLEVEDDRWRSENLGPTCAGFMATALTCLSSAKVGRAGTAVTWPWRRDLLALSPLNIPSGASKSPFVNSGARQIGMGSKVLAIILPKHSTWEKFRKSRLKGNAPNGRDGFWAM